MKSTQSPVTGSKTILSKKQEVLMSVQLPNDPAILLSYINTQLRDHYPSLEELCASLNLDASVICQKLDAIGYIYNSSLNQFQ